MLIVLHNCYMINTDKNNIFKFVVYSEIRKINVLIIHELFVILYIDSQYF